MQIKKLLLKCIAILVLFSLVSALNSSNNISFFTNNTSILENKTIEKNSSDLNSKELKFDSYIYFGGGKTDGSERVLSRKKLSD